MEQKHNIADLGDKMRLYFAECAESLSNKGMQRAQRKKASLAGLCKYLGLRKAELLAMEGGTEEEALFFEDLMLEYELAVEQMKSASMISDKEYADIRKSFFAKDDTLSEGNITFLFPDWHAPDDWEDYLDIKRDCENLGISIRRARVLLSKGEKP